MAGWANRGKTPPSLATSVAIAMGSAALLFSASAFFKGSSFAAAEVAHDVSGRSDTPVDSPVHVETIAGLEVVWQEPPFAGSAKGMVLLFHGCSHSAGDFFNTCENCLGLPEERTVVQAAHDHRLVAVAVSSSDREFSRCWSPPRDLTPTKTISTTLRARLGLEKKPMFAIGASSGGGFVAAVASEFGPSMVTAVSTQIMSLPDRVAAAVAVPIEFVTMPRDEYTEEAVGENLRVLRSRGIPTQKRSCEALPLSPPTVLAERTRFARDPLTEAQSRAAVAALQRAGMVSPSSHLLASDPRGSDWRMVLERASDPEVPGVGDMELAPDESALSEVLNVAWAAHELCATDIGRTFEFFWAAARKGGGVG